MHFDPRVEISFKNIDQLREKVDFCIDRKIDKINIPCKGHIKKNFLLEVVKYLGENYKNLNIVYHYSLFHQFTKNKIISFEFFNEFIELINKYGNNEILLVSGTKKRKDFDVLSFLEILKKEKYNKSCIGVAFNPYFPSSDLLKLEQKRLLNKINTGLISSIWLQNGSNLVALASGYEFITKNLSIDKSADDNNIKIYGSVFIPSKQFLNQFRFRPWNGVFLSDSFLNSLEYANKVTKNILIFYNSNEIIPVIENDFTSEKKYQNFINLIDTREI